MAALGNKAAWLMKPLDLRVMDYEDGVRPLRPGEVRVQVKNVGICGSDVHYYHKGRIADFVVNAPMVIGHESSGVVHEVGEGVRHLKPGDRVAMEPGIPCRCCSQCKGGEYNLCPDMKFFATPPEHGSLANFVVHPADFCFPLPDGMTLEEGAMCEPLSVGVHACRRAGVQAGQKVLVLGAGPIGLCTMLVAKAFGVSQIVITDVSGSRLAVAKQLGAAHTLIASNDPQQDAVRIRELFAAPADVCLDCCGFTSTMQTGLAATRNGGKVCLIGMGHSEMTLPMCSAACREVDVLGVFRYRNTYPTCIDLISGGKVDVRPLITSRLSLENFDEDTVKKGFEEAAAGNAIKVMFAL